MRSVDEMNKCTAETNIRTARCRSRYHRQFCIAHALRLPYVHQARHTGNVPACWRELCEGAGQEAIKQEKNNGFKRWFFRLGEALIRHGVEGVNAHLGTPERVAGQHAATRVLAAGGLPPARTRGGPQQRSTLWCRRRPLC
jgi:hypothetical protein